MKLAKKIYIFVLLIILASFVANSEKSESRIRSSRRKLKTSQGCNPGGPTIPKASLKSLANDFESKVTSLGAIAQYIYDNSLKNTIAKVLSKVSADFGTLKVSEANKSFANYNCDKLSLDESKTLHYFAISTTALPCSSGQPANFCLSLDTCGTFALAMNAGSYACIGTLAGAPLGPFFAGVAKAAEYAAFGFSKDKKFIFTVDLLLPGASAFEKKTYNLSGHAYFGITGTVPSDILNKVALNNGKKLGDYVTIQGTAQVVMDIGTLVNDAYNAFTTKGGAGPDLKKMILNSGAEAGIKFSDGEITIKMSDLTKGVITDIKSTKTTVGLVVTTGSGSSGLKKPGLYLTFSGLASSTIKSSIKAQIDKYLKAITNGGFQVPNFDDGNFDCTVFIENDRAGIYVTSKAISVECQYEYGPGTGRCSFGSALLDNIKDVAQANASKAIAMTGQAYSTIKNWFGLSI